MMIPVSIITGFLGSGKTTLLGRLLREQTMSRTAVIINEFGSIALDHDLIETSDENFVQLSNGCLCCAVQSDLVRTLCLLAERRATGTVPPFERVVIETSGLVDPAPVLHALMTDRVICEIYTLDGVVTTVDAMTGCPTLDRYEESRRQVAVADRIVLTKTDIPGAQPAAVRRYVERLNPGAPVVHAVHGAVAPSALFDSGVDTLAGKIAQIKTWLTPKHVASDSHIHHRGTDISSFCIVREAPLHAVTLPLFLSALTDNCGPDLLRLKGIVKVAEDLERPVVVHGVQHVHHAPIFLDRWPSADRRTRMVLIGRGIPESWAQTLLDLIEEEVVEEDAKKCHARLI